MSDRSERLFAALNEISDRHIDETAEPRRKPSHWKGWTGLAACVTLAVMTVGIFPYIGGCGASGGAPETENADAFMHYAGPILPLTLQEENEAITAERQVTLDFAPWVPVWRSNEEEAASRTYLTAAERQQVLQDYNEWYPEGGRWETDDDLLVEDVYTLTNHGEADLSVEVQLPFAASLDALAARRPTLTLDGQPMETALLLGGPEETSELAVWQDYEALLADGSYRAAAGEAVPSPDTPVIVYAFTDAYGPEPTDEAPNPSIRAGFDLDYEATQVLTYGFNGGRNDWEAGHMLLEFSIPRNGQQMTPLLILLGEDMENLTVGGYVTGGSDPDTAPLPSAGVTVTRYEAELDGVLRHLCDDWAAQRDDTLPLDGESLYRLFLLEVEEAYGQDPAEINRRGGWLEDQLVQMVWRNRVNWVTAEVHIPAGESRTLTATSRKEPSYDYYGAGSDREDVRGFDLLPLLDSNLTFTAQTVRLEDRGQIDLLTQDFGFDLVAGVREAELDLTVPRYGLEVSRKAGTLPEP